jgi:hypothetical protein
MPKSARFAPLRYAFLLRSRTSDYIRVVALATMLLVHVQSFGRFDEIFYLVERTSALTLPDTLLHPCSNLTLDPLPFATSFPRDQACQRQADSSSIWDISANLWIVIGDFPADRFVGELVFTRQEDGVVCEPKCDAFEGEVSEWDFLDIDDVVTSILAGQISRHVGVYVQLPYLESLRADAFVVKLRERNLVEQPVGAYAVGHMLRAVGEMNLAVEGMAIPLLGAGELPEVGRAKFQFLHNPSPSA